MSHPNLSQPQSEYSRHAKGRLARTSEHVYLNRRKVATAAAAVLAIGLGYHVIFGQNGLTAYEQKRQNSVTLTKEVGKLQQENDLLQGHVERLQNDPSAIEHQARQELRYTRTGEVIWTLPAAPDQTHPVPPLPSSN
jgi:cell division protein FtsB